MVKLKRSNVIKFLLFIVLVTVGILILFKNKEVIFNIDIKNVVRYMNERRSMAVLLYLMIYIIKPFLLFIPSNIVAIIGGVLFGPIKGFTLSIIGFFLSGTIAFCISIFLGRDFVESIIGSKLIKLDDNMEENGFKILFMLRLPPILPYDPLSYACGFTRIKYRDFILASLLGVVPETLCYSILGENFDDLFSIQCLIPIIILFLGVLFSGRIIKNGK